MTLHPQYVTDKAGNKSAVLLPIKEYEQLLEELEELEDIRLYDEAKAGKQEFIPAADVFKAVEQKRKQD